MWLLLDELVRGEQVRQRDRLVTAWAQPAWAETAAPRVALLAALLAAVADLAARAHVDGVGAGDDGLDGR